MQPRSNKAIWILVGVAVGALLVLVAGYLISTLFAAEDSGGVIGDDPRNPPATGAVAIQSFTLEPGRIRAGDCTTLTWVVTNAERVALSRDGEVIYNALMEDSYQDCLKQAGIYRYRVDASNSDGKFYNWSELQVIVE